MRTCNVRLLKDAIHSKNSFRAVPTLCSASSCSLLFFSSCLLAAFGCSSWERLVDEWAFWYSSLLWAVSARALRKVASASCCQNRTSKQQRPREVRIRRSVREFSEMQLGTPLWLINLACVVTQYKAEAVVILKMCKISS